MNFLVFPKADKGTEKISFIKELLRMLRNDAKAILGVRCDRLTFSTQMSDGSPF